MKRWIATVSAAAMSVALLAPIGAAGAQEDPAPADPAADPPDKTVAESETGSYIVVMEADPLVATIAPDDLDTPAAEAQAAVLEETHDAALADAGLDSADKVQDYTNALNGFSALISHDEAVKLAGADPDFHRRDLFEAITAGNFPEWELGVQLFTEEQADSFPFDHLDATKLIPEELIPLKIIGRMVLDRWPDNFFAETEQVAFCPSHLVPGIDFSNDPLLQGRLFSYLDTQLSRLGSPNFHQLPINAPKCPFANQQRDGHMQHQVPKGRVAYEPSSLQGDSPREDARAGFHSFAAEETGVRGRIRAETFADHYSQARLFYTSQTAFEQAHMASALVFELSKVDTLAIRELMVGHLRHIDEGLANRVADGLGLEKMPEAPPASAPLVKMKVSPALQIIGKMKATLEGRAVGILINDGSDAKAINRLAKAARSAGATVKIVAPKVGGATLSDGAKLAADGQLAGTPSINFDAVAIVLSAEGAAQLSGESAAIQFVQDAFGHLKAIALDDGGRSLFDAAGLKADEGVVAAKAVDDFIEGAKGRFFEREAKVRILA